MTGMIDESGNPFRPGTAELPPVLAGRGDAQREFAARLKAIAEGEVRPTAMQLVGPRGCGKTTLLNWMEQEAIHENVYVITLPAEAFASTLQLASQLAEQLNDALADMLRPPKAKQMPGLYRLVKWINRRFINYVIKRTDTDSPHVGKLVGRCLNGIADTVGPLLAIVDEAHNVPPEVAGVFYDRWQVSARKRPMHLVIAGTPDLPGKLIRCKSSFTGRFLDHRIGRLHVDDSTDALKGPFEGKGITFPAISLKYVLEAAQDYPYFLQVWGRALWNSVSDKGSGGITFAQAKAAASIADSARRKLYTDRFNEMADAGILALMAEMALEAKRDGRICSAHFDKAAKGLLEAKVVASMPLAREAILHTGFVWNPDGSSWDFGIPSLVGHVSRHAPRFLARELAEGVPPETVRRSLDFMGSQPEEEKFLEQLAESVGISRQQGKSFLRVLLERGVLISVNPEEGLRLATPLLMEQVAVEIESG